MRENHTALGYKLNFPYTEIVETSGYEFTAVSYLGNEIKVTEFTQQLRVLWESSVSIGSEAQVTSIIQHSLSEDYILFGKTVHSSGIGGSDLMVLTTSALGVQALTIGGTVYEYSRVVVETQD